MFNSLDAIIKSTDFAQKINSQLSINNSVMQMMHSQDLWQNKLSALTMRDAIFKGIGNRNYQFPKNFAGIDMLSNSILNHTKSFKIPDTTLDAIKGISQIQESIFENLKGISSIIESQKPYLAQINSLQFAMSGISGQIAAIAAINNQWNLLEEFEDINEEVSNITNNFTSDLILTEEETKRFEILIEKIIFFFKSNKKFGKNALLFISVVLHLMTLHQYYEFVTSKPATTKEDLIKFERRINQTIEQKLKEQKEFRTTNRILKVMLKPKSKTLVVCKLPKGFDVIILQINHKWAYVSYTNPEDNLMETGWVMKKYLDKN